MANPVKAVPEGFHTITPSITCRGAAKAIDFYKNAFGAQEVVRMATPDGTIMHAELKIGDSLIMLNDEMPGMAVAPNPSATPCTSLFLYVPDVDSFFHRAVSAGAQVTMPLQDMFWGDRYGKVTDAFGHHWGLATHVEDVAPDEMERRSRAFMAKAAG
jgi:PhnB protein